ncbi:hypothetical protein SAMD00019534_031540 [Acytostelium subglobosum LB1]|uniref:hypothetical protein n=1 Tax=Acytostelium subglobosum LB1 TaxID=1410327 RepID=UPI000644803C|nr:hypothetical protein SAMD00019534_031540 [Acytostelium subglobosum LB1]GAM19979.1 hypothetical protein SAMD00019534_031540 [Acytostelium subglobosum LB1]|eukprot:XP_012756741.1 hypothetical protein SAMD00019534_031540 [Acytostelium subglobosum LB1]
MVRALPDHNDDDDDDDHNNTSYESKQYDSYLHRYEMLGKRFLQLNSNSNTEEWDKVRIQMRRQLILLEYYRHRRMEFTHKTLMGQLGLTMQPLSLETPIRNHYPVALLPQPYLCIDLTSRYPNTLGELIANNFPGSIQVIDGDPGVDGVNGSVGAMIGRFNYGIHMSLSSDDIGDGDGGHDDDDVVTIDRQSYSYLAMLGDPVERVIRAYNNHRAHMNESDTNITTIEQWIKTSPQANNEQTRMLAGIGVGPGVGVGIGIGNGNGIGLGEEYVDDEDDESSNNDGLLGNIAVSSTTEETYRVALFHLRR